MKAILGGILPAVFMTTSAQAALRTERIEYRHGETVLEGYLAYDNAVKGKRPGVLVAHEWWGLNDYTKWRTAVRGGRCAISSPKYSGRPGWF